MECYYDLFFPIIGSTLLGELVVCFSQWQLRLHLR